MARILIWNPIDCGAFSVSTALVDEQACTNHFIDRHAWTIQPIDKHSWTVCFIDKHAWTIYLIYKNARTDCYAASIEGAATLVAGIDEPADL